MMMRLDNQCQVCSVEGLSLSVLNPYLDSMHSGRKLLTFNNLLLQVIVLAKKNWKTNNINQISLIAIIRNFEKKNVL